MRIRWRFQFNLKMLPAATAVIGLLLAREMRRAERQAQATLAVRRMGGSLSRDEFTWIFPRDLRMLLGEDLLTRVKEVHLYETDRLTEPRFKQLGELSDLKTLKIAECNLSGSMLMQLESLENLQELVLQDTAITDAGLQHVGELTNLRALTLRESGVSDAGLEHLAGFQSLTQTDLRRTKITAAGVAKLQAALPKCLIACDAR